MPLPHRIRLRGFWATAVLPDGRVRHARRFGRPTGTDAGERVWLVGDAASGPGIVLLNGNPLGPAEAGRPWAFDVTDRLQFRNEVAVEVAAPADAPVGEVAVEVR